MDECLCNKSKCDFSRLVSKLIEEVRFSMEVLVDCESSFDDDQLQQYALDFE